MSTEVANQQDQDLIDQLRANEVAALVQCAAQLFAGEITVERSIDPEDPAVVYAVFRVAMSEPRPTIDVIIDRELA